MPFAIWLDAIPGLTIPSTANSSVELMSQKVIPELEVTWPLSPPVPQLLEVGGNDTVNRKNILLLDLTGFLLFPLQDAFQAFHINPTLVQKFLKPLLIGELAPGEPSQDRDKNVSIYSSAGVQAAYSHHSFPLGMLSREGGEFSVTEHLHVEDFHPIMDSNMCGKRVTLLGVQIFSSPQSHQQPISGTHSRHSGWTEPILKGNGN